METLISEFYDNKWENEQFINWGRFEFTLKVLPPNLPSPLKILDLGSGIGHFSQFLVNNGLFKQDEITCSDISPYAIKSCKDVGFKAFTWDIEKSPTPEQWDLIFFLECFEHTIKPQVALKNLKESLKPDGFLVLSTPNFVHIYWRLKCLLGLGHEPPGNGHISLFTSELAIRFFADAGLKVKKELYITRLEMFRWPGKMAALVKKSLSPKTFQPNDYNYIQTPFWKNLFGEIMIFCVIKH